MANELTVSVSVAYDDLTSTLSAGVQAWQRSVSTKRPLKTVQNIGLSEEALIVGDGGTFGLLWVLNLDGTNFVNVKTGTGGVIVAKLLPGQFCLIPLGSGMQAPWAIADTGACNVEVMTVPV